MLTKTSSARPRRTVAGLVGAAAVIPVVGGLLLVAGPLSGPASAAVLGSVSASPLTGNDQTLFNVFLANAACPTGSDEALFDIKGADIGELGGGTTSGSDAVGNLGAGTLSGPQSAPGNSIANLRTTNSGAFSASGSYQIRFLCLSGVTVLASYESTLNYVAGGGGAFAIVVPSTSTPTPTPTATSSVTPTVSPTVSQTVSPTVSPTASPSVTPSVTPAVTPSVTPIATTSVTPTTTTSPTTSATAEPTPIDDTGVLAEGTTGSGAGGGGGLPLTGNESLLMLVAGIGALAGGTQLVLRARR